MNKMLNHLKTLILCFFVSLLFLEINAQTNPNIVLVMADDIGVGDIGFYHKERTGQKPLVPTPNIDKLIEKGMRFSDAHSPASLCAPTRFSMMTGNFVYRNTGSEWGVWSPSASAGIKPNFTTIAEIAKQGGYATAFMGKWGLGGLWNARHEAIERYTETDSRNGGEAYGFDYSLLLAQGIQNKPYAFYENGKWMKLKNDSKFIQIPFKQTGYGEEDRKRRSDGIGDSNWNSEDAGPILANRAVEYINEQEAADKPFFLYYCSQAVHVPHTPSHKLNGIKIAGTTLGKHGDMIKELDAQVGMMIKALKKTGNYDNTLFVFTSDNGGLNNDAALRNAGHDSSNGLTGKKGSIYEGGHRVPFVAVWPGKIKPGSEADVTVVGQDMVATLAAVVGVPLDNSKVFDSANLLPVFKGESEKQVRQYILHASQGAGGPFYALRDDHWKVILKAKNRKNFENLKVIGFYNLAENSSEDKSYNLMNKPECAERINDMKAKYLELRESGASTIY